MINIIAAASRNGVIGVNNQLPFYYKSDLKHFKEKTINKPVIMGKNTYYSIGKPLPNRTNIVVTKESIEDVNCFDNLLKPIDFAKTINEEIWIIGGAKIYESSMLFVDNIILTITPDFIENKNSIYFPFINPLHFKIKSIDHSKLKADNLCIVEYQRY